MAQIKLNATYGMTGTLPAVSGANLTSLNGTQVTSGTLPMARLSGTLPALNGSALTTLNASNVSSGTLNTSRYVDSTGLSHADQYRVSADFTGDQAPITQWELTDTDGFGGLGTSMGLSSGVFTFATTGIWLISMYAQVKPVGTGACGFVIQTTASSNGIFDTAARNQVTGGGQSNEYLSFLFDVTNTSWHTVKFSCEFDNQSSGLGGHSTETKTGCTFLRLGDT